jgi:hypothetical protein
LAARQLVKLDPYFIVGWVRMRDAAAALDHRDEVEEAVRQLRAIDPKHIPGRFGLLQYALAYGRADEARAALREIISHWPEDGAFAQQLLPWALGEPGIDPEKVRVAIADAPQDEASYFLIARQDVDGYNAYIKTHGAIVEAYYFANLYSSEPAGHTMLRDPRVKAMLVRYGFPAYWREKGWPSGCRRIDESDFECGLATTSGK